MTQPTSGVEHGDEELHESHGHSMAAWIAVGIILVGTLVMALAVAFPSVLLFVVGAVVVVAGAIAGKVLSMAGYGDKASKTGATKAAGGNGDLPGRTQSDSGTQ